MKLSTIRKQAIDLLFISLGIALYSFGFCAFTLPHNIVIGGMAGFSTLIHYASGGAIPISLCMYGANALLLLCGMRTLGKAFVLRTIFGATMISMTIGMLEGYFTAHPPLIASAPMSIAMGSVLMGLGIGIYYSHHGTCGGTDIVAAIMSQRTSLSMGRVMMVVDISIVALSFLLPFDGSMEDRIQMRTETIIYGWLAICAYSLIADRYLSQGQQAMQFIIVSEKWEEVAHRLTHETGRGVTTWEGKGFWTKEKRTLILLWCRKTDAPQIFYIANEVDPNAIITNSYVRSVYGNGFDHLKAHKKGEKRKRS
ncbi:MAG: YitT family protein [Bacteroidaceae bacterium]|nr:YitT family protein [Bacteroidaceae bacterium]